MYCPAAWPRNFIRSRAIWQKFSFPVLAFDMHDKALTQQAARLFPQLGRFKGFYLVGGTALAMQIGHRLSVDFGLFSEQALPANFLQKLKRIFSRSSLEVTYRSADQINALVDGVKTTFFYYPYPVLDPFVTYQKVPLASLAEISAMKAFAIGKRLAYKDYVDWYFLLSKSYITLPDIIELAQRKFGADFNDRLFLGQLASLEDIPEQKIDFLGPPVDRSVIEAALKTHIEKFVLER